MTEQTNAELIAEAQTHVTDEYITPDTRPEESLIRRLAAALEAADQRVADAEELRDAVDHIEGAVEFQDAINPAAVRVLVQAARAAEAAEQRAAELAAVLEKVRSVIESESGWFRYRAERVSDILATAQEVRRG